ncbi:MAG TPA: ABC transporter substrate-binding protein [Streptosporangiaceae bacterium]|jgi:ABC-type branched-subunit amino acid transport system substrate-binding protein|nr:ABC transporter substrate-binding protein [Streptosporangiaceae bacterium]
MLARRKAVIPLAGVVASAIALSACSSGTSAGNTSAGTAGASSSLVKLGIVTDVGNPGANFADEVAAARAAVRGVNRRGGIDGHQVQLVFCNEDINPNQAQACVREMISDKVMATVGDEIVSDEEGADKLLSAAGIPSVSPESYSYDAQDPNSYLIAPGQEFLNAAQAEAAVKYGGKRVGLLRVDVPTTVPYVPALQKALTRLGGVYAGQAVTAESTIDFSPYAAGLMHDKADVVTTDTNEAAATQIFKTMASLGFSGKEVVAADALQLSTVKSLGSLASRLIFVSPFPPASAAAEYPGMKQFNEDMAAELAAGDKSAANYQVFDRGIALEAYFGVIAIQKIADQAKVSDSAGLKKTLDSAKNVDLGGVIPPWTPNKSISKVIPRASNDAMYISVWSGGKLKLLTDKPIAVASLVDATNS